MRGLSALEQRSEQLRSWTFLGLLADDVALATVRYPTVPPPQQKAVIALLNLVSPTPETPTRRPVIPRRRSMADPDAILHEAAALAYAKPDPSQVDAPNDLEFIREPLKALVEAIATDEQIGVVRTFAEVLARVTLSMTEQLANEKVSIEWTTPASPFLPT